MTLRMAVAISLPLFLGLSACDKVSTMTQSGTSCGDASSLELVNSLLTDNLQAQVRSVASYEDTRIDSASLRASANQVSFRLDDVRTTKKDPNSTKQFCSATLTTTLDADMIKRANFVRDYYEQGTLDEGAFQQDLNMDGNTLTYDLEYAVQPTDDGKKTFGQLQNGMELLDFAATAVVYAMQKNEVQAQKARAQIENTQNAIAERKAIAEEQALIAQAEAQAGREVADELAQASREMARELASIAAEQAKAKTMMDYKRKEFNILWKSASAEIREALAEGQQEWVAERDEICIDIARESEPARQEIARMECITELLGERYYKVKEYIDTYDSDAYAP